MLPAKLALAPQPILTLRRRICSFDVYAAASAEWWLPGSELPRIVTMERSKGCLHEASEVVIEIRVAGLSVV